LREFLTNCIVCRLPKQVLPACAVGAERTQSRDALSRTDLVSR